MSDFQKRRGFKAQVGRVAVGAAGITFLALITLFAAQGAWHMYGKFNQAAAAREAAEANLVELTREHERASTRVAELDTSRGIEAEVRERYGLARPGEGEIVVVRPKNSGQEGSTERGLWERFWSAFFVW